MDLKKPARLQVDPELIPDDDKPPQTGHTFNVWYLQWAGGDPTTRGQIKLKFRLNVANDSGYTRAKEGKSPICLFYARGCCFKGKECSFLHRPPKPEDIRMHTQDCFGRDKTAEYKDDMSGVGLLARTNRTLYVGGIIPTDHIHDQISKQFLEYGAIDQIKVLPTKKCAFVRYRLEAEAQFAKEVMDAQSLGEKDILSVRWAIEDMSQDSQKLAAMNAEALAMETVKRLLESQTTSVNSKRQKSETTILDVKKNVRDESSILRDEKESETPICDSNFGSIEAQEQIINKDELIDEARLQALRRAVARRTAAKKNAKQASTNVDSWIEKTLASSLKYLSGYSSEDED